MWSRHRPMLFVMLAVWMVACSAAQASPAWVAQKEVGANVVGTPGVALAPGGDLVVAWATPALAGNVIAVASRPVGGAFTSTKTLSQDPSDTRSVRVAASRSGYAVVAWRQQVSGANWRAAAAVRTPAGTWGPPVPLSADGADASDVSVGISDAGEALASWVRAGRVQVSRHPPGASWTPAEDISPFGVTASAPRFDMTRQGHAVVFWIHSAGVAGAHRAPGGAWQP